MPKDFASVFSSPLLVTLLPLLSSVVQAQPSPSLLSRTPDGVSPPEEIGPPISANALRDTAYLPAQIGGIVGAYAVSLVLVAITLLALGKKRREQLNAGNDEIDFDDAELKPLDLQPRLIIPTELFATPIPNFSYPSPRQETFEIEPFGKPESFIHHSPASSVSGPGINPFVDQNVVFADRIMAQNQLEEMYKHVMEHEDAKQRGVQMEKPVYPMPAPERSVPSTLSKKEKVKPASLNLSAANGAERPQSKTASILSALRSPKKKKSSKGLTISSPMMTPQSATFPRQTDPQALGSIPVRHYTSPPPPPPVPTDQEPLRLSRTSTAPMTPDYSPESVQSIDERLGAQLEYRQSHAASSRRVASQAYTEPDPESAISAHSQVPLVGLPSSPKPGATFPSLPSSPKPGATFQRPNAPSAVRTGGALPLRAYEAPLSSPSIVSQTTKQTVFERKGPLSPMTARTPGTAVPYSPYQPFTPCMPMTPSLVTKEERKRMRKMVPKTPTLEMVRSEEDIW